MTSCCDSQREGYSGSSVSCLLAGLGLAGRMVCSARQRDVGSERDRVAEVVAHEGAHQA